MIQKWIPCSKVLTVAVMMGPMPCFINVYQLSYGWWVGHKLDAASIIKLFPTLPLRPVGSTLAHFYEAIVASKMPSL